MKSIESDEDKKNPLKVSRRTFLKITAGTSAGVTFGFPLTSCSSNGSDVISKNHNEFTNAWIHIPEKGSLTFTCPRSEMGQGISTGLASLGQARPNRTSPSEGERVKTLLTNSISSIKNSLSYDKLHHVGQPDYLR